MFEFKMESGTRRIYETAGGSLTVEVTTVEHSGIRGGAMEVYVRRGWVPRFMDRTLAAHTYFRLPDGTQVGQLFNPTITPSGEEVDFEWMLEATPENEVILLAEIARRFSTWVEMLHAAAAAALAERERGE